MERLRASRSILVVCGAGVSTASGIPDFRGPGGVWTRRRPVHYDEFLASEAARVEYLGLQAGDLGDLSARAAERRSPRHRGARTRGQNCLGRHAERRWPASSRRHVTGACSSSCTARISSSNARRATQRATRRRTSRTSRRPDVRRAAPAVALLKSATISFGQSLRASDLERAAAAAVKADLVLALGSTLSVYPAASIPLLAAERGTPVHHHQPRRERARRSPCVTSAWTAT